MKITKRQLKQIIREFAHPSGDPLDHGVTDETYWADVFMDEMRDFISQYGVSAWDDGMAETVRAAVLDGLGRAFRDADSLADEARDYPE